MALYISSMVPKQEKRNNSYRLQSFVLVLFYDRNKTSIGCRRLINLGCLQYVLNLLFN